MARVSLLTVSLLVTVLATVALYDNSLASAWPSYAMTLSSIWMAAYLTSTAAHFRSVYLLATTYVGPLAVFHLTWVAMHAIGERPFIEFRSGSLAEFYRHATWLTVVAFGALGCGMGTMMCLRQRPSVMRNNATVEMSGRTLDWIFLMGIGLLLASILFFFMFIAVAGNPLHYTRADFFESAAGGRGLGAFLMVFPGAVIALLVGARSRTRRVVAWSMATLAFGVILLSGYRSQAMYPLLVAVVLLSKCGRRIPVSVAVAGLAFLLVAIPVIGQLRQTSYAEIDTQAIKETTRQASITDGLMTLGGTQGVLAKAIEVVPARVPFQYGYSYWVAIKDALPNISLTMNSSARLAALGEYARGTAAIFELPPGDWMTYIIDPDKFRIGHGVGFSAIAEPYINFGYGGVVVFFFLLGLFFAWLEHANLLLRPWLLLLTCSTYWALLRTVRNSMGNFIKPLVFVLVVLAIWWLAVRVFSRSAHAPRRRAPSGAGRDIVELGPAG